MPDRDQPTLTRRTCLTRIATAAACGLAAPQLRLPGAEPVPVPQMPLAFSLYGMPGVKVADGLAACAQIGYDGVELVVTRDAPTEPSRLTADDRNDLRKRLGDAGLSLSGLMENLREPADPDVHRSNLERLKAAAELGHVLSPAAPPVIETVLGGRPAQWDEVRHRLAERLQAWAEVAAAAKTVIAVKPHVGNALHTPDGARWLIAQVNSPWIRLAFDYSHFVLQGFPMEETVAALLPETRFIHVKDARGTPEKFEFLLPGDGGLDYATYFQSLKKAGHRGAIVVEVSGQISSRAGYDPIAAARRSYENLAPALHKAGVR